MSAPSFGKPPKSGGGGGGRDGGGGFWGGGGGGGDRSDEPGPGEHYDPDRGAWGQMGKTGPSFTFGGGGGGGGGKGGGSSSAAARDASSSSSFSVPGPGAYYRDGDDGDDAVDRAGGRTARGFSFGGRTGKAWDAAGPGGDAPGPGTYYNDVHQLGRGVADRVKGPGTSPAFSFGTGPRSDLSGSKASEVGRCTSGSFDP